MQQRPPQPGQSLSEYGLIGALVALVVIPGLMALGGNLSGSFTGMLNFSEPAAATSPTAVTHLPGAVAPAAGQPPAADAGQIAGSLPSAPPSFPSPGTSAPVAGATMNYSQGTITISTPGGGTQTASVEGTTQLLAQQLEALAMSKTLPDGSPMPPDLAPQIKLLAEYAYAMADKQAAYPLSQINPNDARDLVGLSEYGGLFAGQYDKVMSLLAPQSSSSSSYQSVQETISTYSGVISRINNDLFLYSAGSQNDAFLVGDSSIDVSGFTQAEGSTATRISGGKIEQTAAP